MVLVTEYGGSLSLCQYLRRKDSERSTTKLGELPGQDLSVLDVERDVAGLLMSKKIQDFSL